jgi:hypothetical protein
MLDTVVKELTDAFVANPLHTSDNVPITRGGIGSVQDTENTENISRKAS